MMTSILKTVVVAGTLLVGWMMTPASILAQGYDYMDPDPAVTSIDKELIHDADAVIRLHHREFELDGPGEGRMTVKKMVTILNSEGLSHTSIQIPYNSFSDVSRVKGAIYDASGEKVRSIKNKHFEDESMISSFSLAEDSRVILGQFTHTTYPFTIEYEYHIDYSGFIQMPAWVPIQREGTALEFGELLVTAPASLEFDHRRFNVPEENEFVFQDDEQSRYRWELSNLPAIEREFMGPPWYRLFPAVVMKTNDFQMDGHDGRMDSWSSLASWVGGLWKGRDELPGPIKQEVDQLVETHGQTRALVDALYRRLQDETRYVSIQLGIGGYQTETAMFTAEKKYGDCKALSNYLLAMLRYAGFEATPAIIRNGSFTFPFDPDFVHNPFNHVVIVVDVNGETVWVEATSSSYPLGYLGASNSNRHALLFDENGGELVKTPKLTSQHNYQKRTATVEILDDGSATMNVATSYGGQQHEHIRELTNTSGKNQLAYIRNLLPYSLYDIQGYEASADSSKPVSELTMNTTVQTFANTIGSRLMFHPNLLERRDNYVSADDDRSQPVYIPFAYHDIDELTFKLPDGFEVEAMPDSVTHQFEHGSYAAKITPSEDGTELTYHREITMTPGVIPVDDYNIYRGFMNSVWESDNNQVVLVKK